MKLSQDQIIFIDTYLKKSDIRHLDVRSEMVDHVAAEVEFVMQNDGLSFYDAFKNFMIVNKKDLLDYNKKFIKKTNIIVLKKLGKQFLSPIALGSIVISFFALQFVITPENRRLIGFVPLGTYICAIIAYYIITIKHRKQRFSGLERSGFILMLFYQFHSLFVNSFSTFNIDIFCALIAVLIGLNVAFLLVIIKYNQKYTKHYILT